MKGVIILLSVISMLAGNLAAQEGRAEKDSTFIDRGVFVNDSAQEMLPQLSSIDLAAMGIDKDNTFIDKGAWVNETPPIESVQDREAREAKDKTWVDPGLYLGDSILTRITGDNMKTPIVVGTFSAYFTYSDTQNTANFTNAYV